MVWQQTIDPLHNLFLSAAVSLLPILFIFWALIIKRMKGYQAALMTTGLAFLVAVIVYQMPVGLRGIAGETGSVVRDSASSQARAGLLVLRSAKGQSLVRPAHTSPSRFHQ